MTTLNNSKKFLFIHIPKNAGTSMYEVWGRTPGMDWHAPAKTVIVPEERPLTEYFKFAFVRNPWDRMWSFYHHVGLSHPETYDIDFNEWLTVYDDSEDRRIGQTASWDEPMSSVRRPQIYWITNDKGEIILDFIGRFEHLKEDFTHVAQRIKAYDWCDTFELQHIRKKENDQNYRDVYNQKGIDHITKYFFQDIKIFGYKF